MPRSAFAGCLMPQYALLADAGLRHILRALLPPYFAVRRCSVMRYDVIDAAAISSSPSRQRTRRQLFAVMLLWHIRLAAAMSLIYFHFTPITRH